MTHFLKIIRVSLIICIIVVILDNTFNPNRLENLLNIQVWGVYFFYSFVLTAINSIYFWTISTKIGWENAGFKKVFLTALGSVIVTLIGFFFCRLIDNVVFNETSLQDFLDNEQLRYYLFPLLFTTIVSLVFHLFYFYKALQEKKVKEQKLIAGTASAKFDALKNQLDPHFLFNSLNVLSSLIEENPEHAMKFTGSLSKIYRYVLEQKDKELVSLEEEMKFARTYADLLKMRFEEGLVFNIPDQLMNPEAKVVPMSLQLLLENTIKHNKVSAQNPLIITITENKKELIIQNNLQIKENLKEGSGVGLQNITQRYRLLTERLVHIKKTDTNFIVSLPLLTQLKKQEIMHTNYEELEASSYVRAREQVTKEREFHQGLIAYAIVIPCLAIFNYLYSDFPWVIFPALGWAIGMGFHAMNVYNWNPFLSKDWEERKIKEIMEKEQKSKY